MIFLGKKLTVMQSTNISLVGVWGVIVDETKYAFVVETNVKTIMLQKHCCTFKIDDMIIEGSMLLHRPEEQLKKWKK